MLCFAYFLMSAQELEIKRGLGRAWAAKLHSYFVLYGVYTQ